MFASILLTWSQSDCNMVPTSSLHCCCCMEWSVGGTSRESSEGNSSASSSSPATEPESRCSAATLHAFCDTRASTRESKRSTWPQHTAFPSGLQVRRPLRTTVSNKQTGRHTDGAVSVFHSQLKLLGQQLQRCLHDERGRGRGQVCQLNAHSSQHGHEGWTAGGAHTPQRLGEHFPLRPQVHAPQLPGV